MLSHMLRMKVAGAICCARGLGLMVFVLSYVSPRLSFILLHSLSYILANKAEIHQKIILKNKNEGANSDEYQILLMYSYTVSE